MKNAFFSKFGLFGLIVLLFCSPLMAIHPDNNPTGWETHSYQDGKFQINFPSAPKSQIQGDRVILTAEDGGTVYMAIYQTKNYNVSKPDAWYNDAFNGLGKKIGTPKNLQIGDLIGQEAQITNISQGMFYVARVLLGQNRCWVLVTAKKLGYPKEALRSQFFDSFKVLAETNNASASTTGKSTTTTTSTTGNSNAGQGGEVDLKRYFTNRSYPYLSGYKTVDGWQISANNLESFIGYDMPGLKKLIDKYGRETVQKSCYAGKEAVRFMDELPQLQAAVPDVIDKFLAEEKKTPAKIDYVAGLPRLLFLHKVIELATAFSEVFADDAKLKEKKTLAEQAYTTALNSAPYIVGDFHKSHIGQVVIFKKPCTVGKEEESQMTNIISPENGTHLMAYFPYHLKGSKYEPGMRMMLQNQEHHQALFFWNDGLAETLEKTGCLSFTLFPEESALNFKSHLEYEQYINFLSRMLDLPNGQHPVEIGFYREAAEKIYTKSSSLIIEMSDAAKANIKTLRDKLIEKRTASVQMPECGDNSSNIANKSDLAQYGTFLKYVQTQPIEEVKDPNWPYPVIGHGTGGWAAIERPGGKVEIIPLTLFKKTGQTVFSFQSIAPMSDKFDLREGSKSYNSGRGEFGYLMKKENVAKCGKWK